VIELSFYLWNKDKRAEFFLVDDVFMRVSAREPLLSFSSTPIEVGPAGFEPATKGL
jgi:hypothetical protein